MASKRNRETDNSSIDEPAPKRRPKMFDGKYYILEEHDATKKSNSTIAKCMLCTVKPSFIKGSLTSTGNFYKHFKNVHNDRLDELRAHCDSKTKPTIASKNDQRIQTTLPFAISIDQHKVSTQFESELDYH